MQKCFDSWDRQPGSSRRYSPTFDDSGSISRRQFDSSGRRLTRNGTSLSNTELGERVVTETHKVSNTVTRRVTLEPGELNSLENLRKALKAKFPNSSSWYVIFQKGVDAVSSSVFDLGIELVAGSFVSEAIKRLISRYGVTSPLAGDECAGVSLTIVLRELL